MNLTPCFLRLAAVGLLLPALAGRSAVAEDPAAQPTSPWVAFARGRVEPPGGIIQIAASRDGVVQEILAHSGDEVARGAVLATLNDEAARLRLAIAQCQLAQALAALEPLQIRKSAAEREVRRLEKLVAQQLANAQDLDQARDRVAEIEADIALGTRAGDTARAQLALAQYDLDACAVRAPVAGQIINRLASPGEGTSAAAATPLFWLAPNGPRVVVAQLDEDSVRLVASGQGAEVVVESSPTRVVKAKVRKVGLFFGPRRPATDDPAERQDVRVVDCELVLENTDPPLLIGQRVLVRFLPRRPVPR